MEPALVSSTDPLFNPLTQTSSTFSNAKGRLSAAIFVL